MLFLLFKVGKDRYALDIHKVVHVLALVHVSPVPDAPRGLAGVFSYRGTLVPVVDLSALRTGVPAKHHFSTRLLLVHYPTTSGGRLVGLIAEQATDVMRRSPSEFVQSGIAGAGAGRGSVIDPRYGIVKWIDVAGLLTPELRDGLFREAVAV